MKVLASTLAGLALAQSDRWTGFDYDYGFGSAERNQISQSSVPNVLYGQGSGLQDATDTPITASNTLSALFNPYGTDPNGTGATYPTFMGNGMMCWHCDADSVYSCFNSGQFQICYGQDYFCYFHERRKIGHYFNRREKYIDNYDSTNTDLFLVRVNNEAWNLDSNHIENNTRNPSDPVLHTDYWRPKTDIHVMAGCQQPQACLRQQMHNQAINIGIAFYGTEDREIGNIHTGNVPGNDNNTDFTTYIHPTSRRNVREGLCRLGKDWVYYSGKLWHYDHGGQYLSGDTPALNNSGTSCVSNGAQPPNGGTTCYYKVDTLEKVNNTPIQTNIADNGEGAVPFDAATALPHNGHETTEVFGRNEGATQGAGQVTTDDVASKLLWGRGIYDASSLHGHQFWHERESWYNGMRPNGFPDQHYHGGKGTESVCHFCCNPASSDGMFCNRRLLDAASATPTGSEAGSVMGVTFADGTGSWMKYDDTVNYLSAGNSDERNQYVDPDLQRADNPGLSILESPMRNSYDTNAAWLSEHRFHGMFRNPETQVSQDFLKPFIAGGR